MKRFSCGDVVPGCDATFLAADDGQILSSVAAHAARDHGMSDVPSSVVAAVRSHIVAVP